MTTRFGDIVSRYKVTLSSSLIDELTDTVTDAVTVALLNTMMLFQVKVNDYVPMDTGALRESFEFEFLTPTHMIGEWETWNPDTNFPYGSYQHDNHKTMSHWVEKSINDYKQDLLNEFTETLRRELD